jgi:hypothetical protein
MAQPRTKKPRPDPPLVIALTDALVQEHARAPKPDPAREQAMLDAVRDCESLSEGWERIIARGLLPSSWLDESERRFYGMSGRCARCGHKDRCAMVRCLQDERSEAQYGFAPFPTSWWDMLVLVGHTERLASAESIAREREAHSAPSVIASPSRSAWTWVFETPTPYYVGLSWSQTKQVRRALDLAQERMGMHLSLAARSWIEPLFRWMRREEDDALRPKVPRLDSELGETGVLYKGQTLGWSELVSTLYPSRDAARALPRGVPMGE